MNGPCGEHLPGRISSWKIEKRQCYIFAMYNCYSKIGKRHLTFSKRLGRQLISLKNLIFNELKLIILTANCNS